jgi:hypothetical protein
MRILFARHKKACTCNYCARYKHNGSHSCGFVSPINKSWHCWRYFFLITKNWQYYLRWTLPKACCFGRRGASNDKTSKSLLGNSRQLIELFQKYVRTVRLLSWRCPRWLFRFLAFLEQHARISGFVFRFWRKYVNRKELEKRIWGKSIAAARKHGLISNEEAEFLVDEYLKEWQAKTDCNQQNFRNLFS